MSETHEAADLERFQDLLGRRLGLRFDDTSRGQLADLLARRAKANRETSSAYVGRLRGQGMPVEEVQALAEELTIPESYFFRHLDQFRAFREAALPERMRARAGRRSLRILSAGCASGEEAYSLAILTRDLSSAGWELSIRGVDLCRTRVERARRGRYSAWSLRETGPELQGRNFRSAGKDFVVDPAIKAMVTFEELNLVDDDPVWWESDAFDVVFCRNVIMYLTPDAARSVARRIARSLAPGGFLFLGHAENLRGLSHDFHLRHTHGAFYYERRDALTGANETLPPLRPLDLPLDVPQALILPEESWVETILHSARRIQSLTARADSKPGEARSGASEATGQTPTWDLGVAFDHLRNERFSEAEAVLNDLPAASAHDPDVLLLKAVLLTHGGLLEMAEKVSRELLALDELNAGAHYVLALCREGMGDHGGAADHDQAASYLDSTFAMPRLHLGMLSRRAGDKGGACRELEQALQLLDREDASRLLLFGGGFSRSALIALCRAEIVSCGGAP